MTCCDKNIHDIAMVSTLPHMHRALTPKFLKSPLYLREGVGHDSDKWVTMFGLSFTHLLVLEAVATLIN